MTAEHARFAIFGATALAFVVLKLCHVIDCSWWWMTAPILSMLVTLVTLVVIAAIAALIDYFGEQDGMK